ncbi:MAG: ATP-dependent DNA helicase RecG [Gemmatimonadota bacterium]|nr:ATP-dependent DNA helicase RecG [Gemmatimonadota bacterium]
MSYSQLDRPAQYLKGVGPKRVDPLGRLGIITARDLLYHTPRRYDDASTIQPVRSLQVGGEATVMGRVRSKGVIPTRKGLRIFQAVVQDESGMVNLAWPGQPWLDRKIREGDVLLATGPVRFFHGLQLQPREFTVLDREGMKGGERGHVFVTYPASEDVPQWVIRHVVEANLDALLEHADHDEYLDDEVRGALGLPLLSEAFRRLHRPEGIGDAEVGRRRLAFDELFFLQLLHAQVRYHAIQEDPGIEHRRTNELIRPLHEALPFQLTDAQARVLREISGDMTSSRRMNRLVQGDVGSGKTLVALFAMLVAVEGGYQAALMAPTEILAEQHHEKIAALLEPLGVPVTLVTGRMSAAAKRAALEAVADGSARVVVGTHALIQEGVEFPRLGLVVVDEQHRFGVRQRMALAEHRGQRPDILIMSATPIPRSLAMTLYGDLDLSLLDELPPGRTPVRTSLRSPHQRDAVYAFVEEEVGRGHQAYVVFPLVEESEKLDLRSATDEFARLGKEVFPHRRVGLLHGKLPSDEKDRVMRSFRDGELDVLVATTVIEVGIDVPRASVMVIEHAERFGLSQLHQLRGRVGRGAAESHCVLVSDTGAESAERLKLFRETADGFEVARADLRLRGQGDLFGANQHGRDAGLRFADLLTDEELLVEAQRRARELVLEDPELEHPGNRRIRDHLHQRYRDRMELFGVG